MQKKVLLSSILVIALCFSVIAGSTYALFTDTKSTNITITSGDVEVEATLNIAGVWSADYIDGTFEDSYLVDEYGTIYSHVQQSGWTFANGGYADLKDNEIIITNITPGDKVDASLTVKNVGNVDMIYRYKIQANDGKLADGMVITSHTKQDYEGIDLYVSEWFDVVGANTVDDVINFSLELPVYAGDEYQSEVTGADGKATGLKDVKYTITVEAVQGNASMAEYSAPATANTADTLEELQKALNALKPSATPIDATITLGADIVGDVVVTQNEGVNLIIDGNGYKYDGSITIGADGASTKYANAPVTIKNVKFEADSLNYDAFIRLGNGKGDKDPTKSRYICNVSVENCQFTDTDGYATAIVAVKSYTGGDENLVISNCVVDYGMHSLLQVSNVDKGLVITGCKVNSKNGVNVVSTPEMVMSNCVFNVEGYAFRTDVNGAYEFNNCTLKSACAEADDAVIVLRKAATENALILNNTTLTGDVKISKK